MIPLRQMPPEDISLTTWIALFRGINVGGHNKLPMKELVILLERLGLDDVKTYIQSGNVVFSTSDSNSNRLSEEIAQTVKKKFGFQPKILLLRAIDFVEVMRANPFSEAEGDPKTLHCFFLSEKPGAANVPGLNDAKAVDERFVLTDKVLYLHAPQGIGRSKFVQRAERLLGVPATARNWRTVTKLAELSQQLGK